MGKHGKKQKNHRGKSSYYLQEDDEQEQGGYPLSPPSSSSAPNLTLSEEENASDEEEDKNDQNSSSTGTGGDVPSKFSLHQQSVQSPKGDISYLQKFFLIYVGGRVPLHLQEDFCGTALLSTEWLCSDSRRTAVGIDLDLEALNWCMENNVHKVGADLHSRIFLFHGNVLQPLEARVVKDDLQDHVHNITLEDNESGSETVELDDSTEESSNAFTSDKLMKDSTLPARDIICGIFVMDLYGGTSSECKIRMQRRFPNFKYTWEQAGFNIIQRKTRISLHFTLLKQQKKLRHAFFIQLETMPDSENIKSMEGFGAGRDLKYEEVPSFQQQDSWNAYIVGVA